jgi:two-component sensor histidine kinase
MASASSGIVNSAAYALAELVRETCSNATRHGSATVISITVRVNSRQRVIDLTIDNDGKPLAKDAAPGIGSQLFDEQTLSWTRKQVGPLVRVKAQLPIALTPVQPATTG